MFTRLIEVTAPHLSKISLLSTITVHVQSATHSFFRPVQHRDRLEEYGSDIAVIGRGVENSPVTATQTTSASESSKSSIRTTGRFLWFLFCLSGTSKAKTTVPLQWTMATQNPSLGYFWEDPEHAMARRRSSILSSEGIDSSCLFASNS